eukprot:m51a1_g11419 hypothetical protein (557) ;mRNA; r:8263-10677
MSHLALWVFAVAAVPAAVLAYDPGDFTDGLLTLDGYDYRYLFLKNNCPERASIYVKHKAGDFLSQTGDWVLEPRETVEVVVRNGWGGVINACKGLACPADKMASGFCAANGCDVEGSISTSIEAGFNINNKWGGDFYDSDIINGVGISIEYGPILQNPPYNKGAFRCGKAGGFEPQTKGIGAASWNFEPPTIYYRWVLYCRTICKNGYVGCDELMPGVLDFPGCAVKMYHGPRINYYGCSMVRCGEANADHCCGDPYWASHNITTPTGPSKSTNAEWVESVLPNLLWMKKAAPSVYVYPADDSSSTFTCNALVTRNGVAKNALAYKATICPEYVWPGPKPPVCNHSSSQNKETCKSTGDCKWCPGSGRCVDWGKLCGIGSDKGCAAFNGQDATKCTAAQECKWDPVVGKALFRWTFVIAGTMGLLMAATMALQPAAVSRVGLSPGAAAVATSTSHGLYLVQFAGINMVGQCLLQILVSRISEDGVQIAISAAGSAIHWAELALWVGTDFASPHQSVDTHRTTCAFHVGVGTALGASAILLLLGRSARDKEAPKKRL